MEGSEGAGSVLSSVDVSHYLHPVLHCNYPSDSELVDTEDHNHTVDTSGCTFSPRLKHLFVSALFTDYPVVDIQVTFGLK